MTKIMIMANESMMVYHHRYELICRFISNGWRVCIATPKDDFVPKFKALGCEFIDVPMDRRGTNFIKDFSLYRHLVSILRTERPDVVLTFYTKANIYASLAARHTGVPYITNITGMGMAIENGGLMQKLMITLYRSAVKRASCVFFQNEYNESFFREHKMLSGFGRLIPGSGVNLSKFSPMKYPSHDSPLEFVFVSRILKEKGIEEYVEAAREIRRTHPEIVFHVVGPCNNEYVPLLKQWDAEGLIHYDGPQEDIRSSLKQSSCMVFPSFYSEGMANVLLEAAAANRPVITTDRPGCRESVEDGVSGFLVNQRDVPDLIEKIKMFIEMSPSERQAMGEAGRRRMESMFNRNIIVDAYEEEIFKIIKKAR